ncbi:CBS domain-containing protein [Mycena sanguinolenta]|uniref:CBS domain-containing protein n=1 Tax=Mycena sanguinolenta TaxID=230812 RepID=A0A8H6WP23_9AGAR|nr:CBS domain-containing protein [Mycena sanguinolenta]
MATAALPAQTGQVHSATTAAEKYRGAVVEDLQLQPAFCVKSSETILRAIEQAYERDFSHIPVLDSQRRPLGYIEVATLKERWEAGKADASDKVINYMTRFNRTASQPYTIITPYTPLAELEEFLTRSIFAIVTDPSRKFVVALATTHDLETFVSRRGF